MKNLLYILLFVPLALFGQENYSLSFEEPTDRVQIPSNFLDGLTNFSLSAMFNANSIQDGYSNIIQFDASYNYGPIGFNCYSDFYIRYHGVEDL